MEIIVKQVVDLIESEYNPREISIKEFAKLQNSIREFGFVEPVVINQQNEIIGGHMRIRAAKELNINDVPCVVVDVSGDRAKLLNLALNRISGEWDDQKLGELLYQLSDSNFDIELSGFDIGEINKYSIGPDVKEDDPPAIDVKVTKSKLNEIYQLGRHRLMCGDSTKAEDVEKLMDGAKADLFITDPPYGVNYADKNKSLNATSEGNRIQTPIENDDLDGDGMKELWTAAFSNAFVFTKDSSPYYINAIQGRDLMMMMMMSILSGGWNLKHMMIWAKNNHVLGRMDYHYQHEPIFYGWKDGKSHNWYGDRSQTSLWQIDKPQTSELHPTMKPIALYAKAIKNSSKQDDIVLDLFLGSGSTLIACEQTNRICYGMELSPAYCDVIRKRYAKLVGKEEDWESVTPKIDRTKDE